MVYSLLAIIIAVSPSPFSRPSQSLFTTEDEGSFILMLKGQQIGTEKFRIHARGDDLEASARIDLRAAQDGTPESVNTSPALLLTPQLPPLSHPCSHKGAPSPGPH